MTDFLRRLRERKLVQWALAYVAAAWVVIEALGALDDLFPIPLGLQRGVAVALAFGLVIAVVLAWYHGEQGRQRVSGPELLIVAGVLVIAGATLTLIDYQGPAPESRAAPGAGEPVARGGERSVAVLPFTDLSPGGDQAYFSYGVAEELRSVLSRIEGLRVASTTSSVSVHDAGLGSAEIGERLGVETLVEGSVRKNEERLRVEARLVSATDGFQLWSGRFDTGAADIFAVQDSIALSVARAFEVRVSGTDAVPAPRGQTSDHEAQDLYLKGRFAWNRRTQASLEEAVGFFQQAVDRDPRYARALAGLADAYAVLGFYDYRPPSEAFPLAKSAAESALGIDSTMAAPHATLGYVALYHDWDWEAAERSFLRAIELDPGYPTAHGWYANYLTAMAAFDEAERQMRVASELDPLSTLAFAAVGWVQMYAGDLGPAIERLASARERDPDFELAYLWGGQASEAAGNLDAAEALIARAVELSDGSAITLAALARVRALAGRDEDARRILSDFEREGGYVPSYEIAKAHVALGENEVAVTWLERALGERAHSLAFLRVDRDFDPIREYPRFQRVLGLVGF